MSVVDNVPFKRDVKSFSKRQRRLTQRQAAAFSHCWDEMGVQLSEKPLNLDVVFGRKNKRVLEIGFGNGDSLWKMAQKNPDIDYLGIEVHQPGIANLLIHCVENDIHTIRLIENDAVLVLTNYIFDQSFSRIQLFFPDPWPKKKHHKRRLIQPDFVQLLRQKLCVGGVMHCATDWENYATYMMDVFSHAEGFRNVMGAFGYADNEKQDLRPNTKFEQRGVRLGHRVWDLLFERVY